MRRFLASTLTLTAALLVLPATANAKYFQEAATAKGVIPEASVSATSFAGYDGVPTKVVLTGYVGLTNLRVKTADTIQTSYKFSVKSSGCSAVVVNKSRLAIGSTVSSQCVSGNLITTVTGSAKVVSKSMANSGGPMITSYDVPMSAARGSKFLETSVVVTVKGAGAPLTLSASRALPNH